MDTTANETLNETQVCFLFVIGVHLFNQDEFCSLTKSPISSLLSQSLIYMIEII